MNQDYGDFGFGNVVSVGDLDNNLNTDQPMFTTGGNTNEYGHVNQPEPDPPRKHTPDMKKRASIISAQQDDTNLFSDRSGKSANTPRKGQNQIEETVVVEPPQESSYMIRYNHPYKIKWDLIVMLLATWNTIVIPIDVSFEPKVLEESFFYWLDIGVDLLFLIDILINF